MSNSIRISSPKIEGLIQVSKWLEIQVLMDLSEMSNLLQELGSFHICITGQIYKESDEPIISKDKFLECYSNYIEGIKAQKFITESSYRSYFSSVFTKSLDDLYKVEIPDNQFLLRVSRPVLQLQAHRMHYSKLDGKFRPMIFGSESIVWGIQFSYPQIFQDNLTKEIISVLKSPAFPNTNLYYALQKWIRKNTIPTPFMDGEKVINSPIRIGKNCLSWINLHPQLIERGLKVKI